MIAVFLLAVSVMPAFAAGSDVVSPQPTKANYIIYIDEDTEGGRAVAEYETEVRDDGKQTVVIHGIPDDGYTFDHWEINGDYTPSGDLTEPDIRMEIGSDINVKPVFTKSGVPATTSAPDNKPADTEKVVDNGSKSPQTGSSDAVAYAVIFVSAVALVAVITIAKRRSTDK